MNNFFGNGFLLVVCMCFNSSYQQHHQGTITFFGGKIVYSVLLLPSFLFPPSSWLFEITWNADDFLGWSPLQEKNNHVKLRYDDMYIVWEIEWNWTLRYNILSGVSLHLKQVYIRTSARSSHKTWPDISQYTRSTKSIVWWTICSSDDWRVLKLLNCEMFGHDIWTVSTEELKFDIDFRSWLNWSN